MYLHTHRHIQVQVVTQRPHNGRINHISVQVVKFSQTSCKEINKQGESIRDVIIHIHCSSHNSRHTTQTQEADLNGNGLLDKEEVGKLLLKLVPLEHPMDDIDAIFGVWCNFLAYLSLFACIVLYCIVLCWFFLFCMCVYVAIHTHIYTCTCNHTYMYTYTYTCTYKCT
jgi:hypothetical protein